MIKINKIIYALIAMLLIQGCSSAADYDNTIFPANEAPWLPVNPENFNKTEAQRIFEGGLIK